MSYRADSMQPMSRKKYIVKLPVLTSLLVLCLINSPIQAAPGGDDLLRACSHSLANDFSGTEGQMCIWYTTPCNCEMEAEETIARVCLPESVSNEKLAQVVISGLQERPELQEEEARIAAALILSRIYACP